METLVGWEGGSGKSWIRAEERDTLRQRPLESGAGAGSQSCLNKAQCRREPSTETISLGGRCPLSGPALLAEGRATITVSPSLPRGGMTTVAGFLLEGVQLQACPPTAGPGLGGGQEQLSCQGPFLQLQPC